MRNIIILALLSASLASCYHSYTEAELVGFYTPVDFLNNHDTIELSYNNIYKRKVWDARSKLVLNMQGYWELTDNGTKIFLKSLYINLDDSLVRNPELVQDTTTGAWISIERSPRLGFCIGNHSANQQGDACFLKIK